MKTVPNIHSAENIVKLGYVRRQLEDGSMVVARPEGFWGLCLGTRLKAAWMVFTGRWDALRWEGQ